MANNEELIKQCEQVAKQWLSPSFDEETRKEVQAMLDNEDKTASSTPSTRISNSERVDFVASWEQEPTA